MTFYHSLRLTAFYVVLSVLGATAAQAHAHLEHAVPANSIVHVLPQQIELSFSEAVEPTFSTVEVADQKGGHVEQGKPSIDPGNAKILRVALRPLTPGTYKVVWRVVSVDTHRSSGSFTFSVTP